MFFAQHKNMKKLASIILLLIVFVCSACENQGLRIAHLCDATQGLSTNYAVKMVLDNDERMKEKYVDLQIKANNDGQKLTIKEERGDESNIFFEKADEWYNLTVLLSNANGLTGHETYEKYEDKGNVTYIFTSPSDTKLTMRVVAGNVTQNDLGTGQVLTSIEEISNEFEIEVEAKKEE